MSVVLRYWSLVDMSEGCYWCDPSFVGTLTHVILLEYVCWAHFAIDYTYAIYIGSLFLLVRMYRTACCHVIIFHTKMSLKIFNSMKRLRTKETPKSFINSNELEIMLEIPSTSGSNKFLILIWNLEFNHLSESLEGYPLLWYLKFPHISLGARM
jgi:hypothetical protein